MSFKPIELYGGAIAVDLPSRFGDASQIRQVPDHQELYLDRDGYSGVIFEILEYVDRPTDEEALQYHFEDLVGDTGDATNVLGQGAAAMPKVGSQPVYTLNFLQTPTAQENPNRKTPDFTSIHLMLLRLKDKATDILITVNVPHYPGEYEKGEDGQPTQMMKDGEAVKEKILSTFEVKDWGLFVN